jgi:hypothetical protein
MRMGPPPMAEGPFDGARLVTDAYHVHLLGGFSGVHFA